MKPNKRQAMIGAKTSRTERVERVIPPVKKASADQRKAAQRLFESLSLSVSVNGWKPYVKA
jgi:hypothetical protein